MPSLLYRRKIIKKSIFLLAFSFPFRLTRGVVEKLNLLFLLQYLILMLQRDTDPAGRDGFNACAPALKIKILSTWVKLSSVLEIKQLLSVFGDNPDWKMRNRAL